MFGRDVAMVSGLEVKMVAGILREAANDLKLDEEVCVDRCEWRKQEQCPKHESWNN